MTRRHDPRAAAGQLAEITVTAAALIAGCSPDTVVRWIEEGAIKGRRLSPRGWWKVERESLLRYLKRCAGPS